MFQVFNSVQRVMCLWKHELLRVIADRFVTVEDLAWFDKYITILSAESLSEDQIEYLKEEVYFVDFLR